MSQNSRPQFSLALLHPRYWLTWFGFSLWWCLAHLPYSWQMALGAGLGVSLRRLAKRRTAIAQRNLELCFPELTELQRQALLAQTLDSVGKAFFETGIAWFLSPKRLRKLFVLEGLEHLLAAEAAGQGVILMGMHFTHLDLGGAMVSQYHPIDGSYRTHANPVYDYIQRLGRERHNPTGVAMPRGDVRGMVRTLKNARAIWYAPDQDYGRDHSVFVPFFGIPAATVTATARLAQMGRARVLPYTHYRTPKGYVACIGPALENFPTGDDLADALRINQVVEAAVRAHPGEYLWVHRRFKTRPEGEGDLYTSVGIAAGSRA